MLDGFEQGITARKGDRSSLHVAVPAQILRGRVHDDISAQLDGPLQSRSGEGSVGDQDGIPAVGDLRQRADVCDLHEWIRRGFAPDDPRLRAQGLADRLRIRGLHEIVGQAPARKEVCGQFPNRVIAVLGEHDMRTGWERLQDGARRGHPRSKRQRPLR